MQDEPTQAHEEERLRRWVEAQVARCIPRQGIEDALIRAAWDQFPAAEPPIYAVACFVVAGEVMRVMEIRHDEGERLERAGRSEEAIRLYKENVGDRYLRPDSYRRLANLYRDRGEHEAVSRVRRLQRANRRRREVLSRVGVN